MFKDFDNFVKYCKNKSIAIVGPAITDENNGIIIDKHDIVVRINNYEKLLYCPDKYGTKVDVICNSFFETLPIIIKNKNTQWVLNTHPLKLRNINNTKYFEISSEKHKNINHSIFPFDSYDNLSSFPTSGLSVINEFIKIINHIDKLSIFSISLNLTSYCDKYLSNTGRINNINDIVGHHNYFNERLFLTNIIKILPNKEKNKINIYNKPLNHFLDTYI